MADSFSTQTRRDAITTALVTAGSIAVGASGARAAPGPDEPGGGRAAPNDWAWLVGRWDVRHRKLNARLAGSTEWDEFSGTCVNWPTLGGQGNVDDNFFDAPGGAYRGVGVRAFDPGAGQWAIWWLDSRFPEKVDTPVRGAFRDGVGTFLANETFNGRPVVVRFMWSRISAASARWEQALSPDGGATWETNWIMDFTRAAT